VPRTKPQRQTSGDEFFAPALNHAQAQPNVPEFPPWPVTSEETAIYNAMVGEAFREVKKKIQQIDLTVNAQVAHIHEMAAVAAAAAASPAAERTNRLCRSERPSKRDR
jgi:hypothetical protein